MTANEQSLRQFNLELDRFIGKLVPQEALDIQQKVALDALRLVVKKSPVKTGRFRGNWHLSTTPSEATFGTLDPQPRGSEPSGAVEAQSLALIASAQPYGIIYLQNALPYAEAIERGHSGQTPLGVLAVSFAELQARVAAQAAEE